MFILFTNDKELGETKQHLDLKFQNKLFHIMFMNGSTRHGHTNYATPMSTLKIHNAYFHGVGSNSVCEHAVIQLLDQDWIADLSMHHE